MAFDAARSAAAWSSTLCGGALALPLGKDYPRRLCCSCLLVARSAQGCLLGMQHVRTALICRWTARALSRSRIFIAGKVSAEKWSQSESKRPALSSAAASEANISSAASASGRSILF